MNRAKIYFTGIACVCLVLSACNMATPENYFDRAVLTSNSMVGFAGSGMQREMESSSATLVEGTVDQTTIMKRKDLLGYRLLNLEDNYKRLKQLKETDDARDILQASIALYEYVLPVYKTEYAQLAKLYDEEAPKEQIRSLEQTISDKYAPGFDDRYNKLIAVGKLYADKHKIKVNWAN